MCDATVITSCLRADNCHMMSQVLPPPRVRDDGPQSADNHILCVADVGVLYGTDELELDPKHPEPRPSSGGSDTRRRRVGLPERARTVYGTFWAIH